MKKKKNAPYSVDMAACTRSDTVMLWISMGVLILFLLMIIYPLLYATIASFTKGTLALSISCCGRASAIRFSIWFWAP